MTKESKYDEKSATMSLTFDNLLHEWKYRSDNAG